MLTTVSLLALVASTLAAKHDFAEHNVLVARQGSIDDFGAGNSYCTCPPVSGQSLVEANAYLPGARNYFLDCQYGTSGEPCTYNTAGAVVNPPSYCPANALPASTSGTEYCYVTCPSSVGGSALDTTQSNVVIVASGTSYTTCRYQNGSNCQYNPLTGALGNTAAGGSCPTTNSKTSGCCFNLGTSGGSTTTTSTSSTVVSSTPSSTRIRSSTSSKTSHKSTSTTPVVKSSTTSTPSPSSTPSSTSFSSSSSSSVAATSSIQPTGAASGLASWSILSLLGLVAGVQLA